MCIVIHKPKGASVDIDTIARCFNDNPDGAGIMTYDGYRVHGNKGFMSFGALWDHLYFMGAIDDNDTLTPDYGMVLHFRWATHGAIKPGNCHPFPVSDRISDLRLTSWQANIGIAHNGVIAIKPIKDLSDTQTYIAKKLFPLRRNILRHRQRIEKETFGSKLLILYGNGDVIKMGDWIEDNGVFYSNKGYKQNQWQGLPFNQWWHDYPDNEKICPDCDDLISCEECPYFDYDWEYNKVICNLYGEVGEPMVDNMEWENAVNQYVYQGDKEV